MLSDFKILTRISCIPAAAHGRSNDALRVTWVISLATQEVRRTIANDVRERLCRINSVQAVQWCLLSFSHTLSNFPRKINTTGNEPFETQRGCRRGTCGQGLARLFPTPCPLFQSRFREEPGRAIPESSGTWFALPKLPLGGFVSSLTYFLSLPSSISSSTRVPSGISFLLLSSTGLPFDLSPGSLGTFDWWAVSLLMIRGAIHARPPKGNGHVVWTHTNIRHSWRTGQSSHEL